MKHALGNVFKPRAVWLLGISFAVCLVSLFIGSNPVGVSAFFDIGCVSTQGAVMWNFRIPRVFMGFIAGSCLSVCGMTFQALFQNPLACPFTLGISSGASLGAVFVICGAASSAVSYIPAVAAGAFSGAMLAVFLVFLLCAARGGSSPLTMLIGGVIISFFFGSVTLFIQYLSDFTQTARMIHWMIGSVEVFGGMDVLWILPFYAAGIIAVSFHSRELDLMAWGDDYAKSKGVDTGRVRIRLFVICSILIGLIVSVCGPIGFVGLAAPHIARAVSGTRHDRLVWCAAVTGGVLLVAGDAAGRFIIKPGEIPAGIVCALAGAPYFIWLLLFKRTF